MSRYKWWQFFFPPGQQPKKCIYLNKEGLCQADGAHRNGKVKNTKGRCSYAKVCQCYRIEEAK